jgi:uncharacterized oxidoreductase
MLRSGNQILITGGASGIGLELAKLFAADGNQVAICGRDRDRLEAANQSVPQLRTIVADISKEDDRQRLRVTMDAELPNLNVLINNAGTVKVCDLTDSSYLLQLQNEIATNFFGPLSLTMHLLPRLQAQPSAVVVNVTTGYVFVPSARTAPYSATKTALHVMTKALRYQLRGTGIQVVEVMPPAVDTQMASHYRGSKMRAEHVARTIHRRLLKNEAEIVVGLSRLPQFLGRAFPELSFRLLNHLELDESK